MIEQSFTIAKRERIIPLIGVFGKSSSGKTLSGLKIARGLVGPKGRIAVIDTENKRVSHFADDPSVAPFYAMDVQPPFSPDAYWRCHEKAVKEKFDALLVDSATHEWTGEGGCLQMVEAFLDQKAGDDWGKRDKWKMAAWAKVTPEHDRLVNALMRSPIPVICCFRAKDKVVMDRDDGGKTRIETDENAPIARKDLIYEMLLALEVFQGEQDGVQSGGYFRIRKPGPPSLDRMLREFKAERLSPKIGEIIAQWCNAPVGPGQKQSAGSDLAAAKNKLWALLKPKFEPLDPSRQIQAANQFLWDENIISDTEALQELGIQRIEDIIPKVIERMKRER